MKLRFVRAFCFLSVLISFFLGQPGIQAATSKTAASKQPDPAKNRAEFDNSNDLKKREEWFILQRAYPFKHIPPGARQKAMEYLRHSGRMAPFVSGNAWTAFGPDSIPNGQTFGASAPVSGRVTAVAIDPTDGNTIYIGGAQGGVWKTVNAGTSWTPLTDTQPTLAVGAIAIDPTNHNVIYVGTGEGSEGFDSYFGAGVLKSTDGGSTFTQLAASTFQGVSFSDLLIDPTNTQNLYAGIIFGVGGKGGDFLPGLSTRGVYQSTNGGTSWNLLNSANEPDSDVTDLEMDPNNTQSIYAAYNFFNGASGIYHTTNGGTNWSLLGGTGFPTSNVGRIAIALAPSSPLTIYAALENRSTGDLLEILKTINGGTSWSPVTNPPVSAFGNICQCFYDNVLSVSPVDPNTVFFGGVPTYKTINGGTSWTNVSTTGSIHPDVHAIVFDPANSSRIVTGNDGGVWISPDTGTNWTNVNSNLAITQFEYIGLHPTNGSYVIGGTQDNGTLIRDAGTNTWDHSQGGDGGEVFVDPNNASTLYHTFFNVSFERSDNGGSTWQDKTTGLGTSDRSLFYVPVAMDPSATQTLYLGSFRLYRTVNRGDSWSLISGDLTGGGSISAIAVAPSSSATIYVGTSDGLLQVSTNNGVSFNPMITGLPNRFVTHIAVDPSNSQVAYVSLSGFGSGHVFQTVNGGGLWTDVSGNLPDIPVNAVVVDSSTANTLYAGSDVGVFITTNGGATWSEISSGLPNAAVFDLQINNNTTSLVAGTHGRGVFKLITSGGGGGCTGLFCDDFSDFDASDWFHTKGTFSASTGVLLGTFFKKADDIAPFAGCTNCTIEVDTAVITPGSIGSVLGWYLDKRNLVEIRFKQANGKILVIQKSGGFKVAKGAAPFTITPGQVYHLKISYSSGTFQLFMDGAVTPLITVSSPVIPFGGVGARVKSTTGLDATSQWDNWLVQ